jgi:cell division protein FtsB
VDESGVALAAIQGLNEKVESGKRKAEKEIETLKVENAELKSEISEIKQLLAKLSNNPNNP